MFCFVVFRPLSRFYTAVTLVAVFVCARPLEGARSATYPAARVTDQPFQFRRWRSLLNGIRIFFFFLITTRLYYSRILTAAARYLLRSSVIINTTQLTLLTEHPYIAAARISGGRVFIEKWQLFVYERRTRTNINFV